MKKQAKKSSKNWWVVLGVSVIVIGGLVGWLFFGSATAFPQQSIQISITENNKNKTEFLETLENANAVRFPSLLGFAGAAVNLWDKLKPGRYEIKNGQSIIEILRMFKNGRRAEVKFVLNKVRTKQELAALMAKTFDADSVQVLSYLSSNDSLQTIETDTTQLFTKIIPDTYRFYADANMSVVLKKLAARSTSFWNSESRIEKAARKNLSPQQIYTLASIVEEETNDSGDKSKIASVYLNRLKIQMPLQACPTIKYAMQDFTITRVYEKYLLNPSPYNTYKFKGLPPGPICTPSPTTIDLVLNAPETDYLYFVAKSDFSGFHHFSSTYEEHDKYAKEYQKKLDEYMLKKQQQNK